MKEILKEAKKWKLGLHYPLTLKSQIAAQFEGNQAAALKIGMLILLCLKNNYGNV
jgi:hypothetical protein